MFKNREKPFRKKLRRWILNEKNWPPESIEEQELLETEFEKVKKTIKNYLLKD